MSLTYFLVAAFLFVTVIDIVFSILCLKKDTQAYKLLGVCLFFAFFTTTIYLISIVITNKLLYSILHSAYFIGVTLTVFSLYKFTLEFTGKGSRKPITILSMHTVIVIDSLIMAINPLTNIAISYEEVSRPISHFVYSIKIYFIVHLAINWIMIVAVTYLLVRKLLSVPTGYKQQYFYACGSILLAVFINLVYLFAPLPTGSDYIDYSLLAYSIPGVIFYIMLFNSFSPHAFNAYKNWIFNGLNEGVVLFDYEDQLIFKNTKVENMMPSDCFTGTKTLYDFLKKTDIQLNDQHTQNSTTFQIHIQQGQYVHPLRCDYQELKNEKNQKLGSMFVFTDLQLDFDLLTGFKTWASFERRSDDLYSEEAMYSVVVDINALTVINEKYGHLKGDECIMYLAHVMRNVFPKNAEMVRGREAHLACITKGLSFDEIKACLKKLQEQITQHTEPAFTVLTSIVEITSRTDIPASIVRAIRVIRTKKLLDHSARHSDVMNSLIQVLQECDKDTENHVQRTQKLCYELGKKLKLSEDDQSNLSLLAILHDIGKVGIPLDILNKPTSLTANEWAVIKTHVDKGARIAASSQDLIGISDMILYHHERWDGKGYPSGLCKENIPLLSRIIAVVDSYDAMKYNRPYHKGIPELYVRQELKRCSGTQFDPTIVSIFLQLLQERDQKLGINIDITSQPAKSSVEKPLREYDWSVGIHEKTSDSTHTYPITYSKYICDKDKTIVSIDDQFEKITGYTMEDVQRLKLTHNDLMFEEDLPEYISITKDLTEKSGMAYIEHRIRTKSGNTVLVFCFGRDYYDSAERSERTEIIITDSSSVHSVQSLLNLQNMKTFKRLQLWDNKYRLDPLTGLLSHETFRNDAETQMLNTDRHRAMMLVLDIDHFAAYNQTNGQKKGDEYLVMASQAISDSLREDDLASRTGSDEFAIMLFFKVDTPDDTMIRRGKQLCANINKLIHASASDHPTISMGASILNNEVYSYSSLYEAAHKALMVAKENGNGSYSY